MSSGVFYAYAKNVRDDVTWRYLIVFASRSVADEWWRAVSTSSNTAFSSTVRRLNPQFYTHDPNQANISRTITEATVAGNFLDKVFFTLLPDRDGRSMNIIPPLDITDHISGNLYYIRAKGDKSVYWCADANGRVTASRTNSTRFLVRTVEQTNTRLIMINSDAVNISVGQQSISVTSGDGFLQLTRLGDRLTFGDFNSGYAVANTQYANSYGYNRIVKVENGTGEQWELTTSGRVCGISFEKPDCDDQ